MNTPSFVYLALGDSMSIDFYTGVSGGGAVNQFYRWLQSREPSWRLVDRTADGARMRHVASDEQGGLITLTIGGNDLLAAQDRYLAEGLASFATEHLELLMRIRRRNADAVFVVGNVYRPQSPLPDHLSRALDEANAAIALNADRAGAQLADIHAAFRGHEAEYLCYDIEPSLQGAAVIARLFQEATVRARRA